MKSSITLAGGEGDLHALTCWHALRFKQCWPRSGPRWRGRGLADRADRSAAPQPQPGNTSRGRQGDKGGGVDQLNPKGLAGPPSTPGEEDVASQGEAIG
jgi:hypothetical protein